MHDAASAWNAGFIRQVCNRHVLLPDKSGVPVVVSRCARGLLSSKQLLASSGRAFMMPSVGGKLS
jgi:hypothetical protein